MAKQVVLIVLMGMIWWAGLIVLGKFYDPYAAGIAVIASTAAVAAFAAADKY